MDREQAEAVAAALRDIRDRVGDILEESPACGRLAGEILRALGRVEGAVFGQDPAPPPNGRGVGAERLHNRNKPKRYIRETVGGQEVLAEYRHDSSIPLRSPKEVLDAIADALGRAAESLSFEEVQAELSTRFGQEPPDYQARIALRFLQSANVGLVARSQARYKAIDSRKVKHSTKKAWETLER